MATSACLRIFSAPGRSSSGESGWSILRVNIVGTVRNSRMCHPFFTGKQKLIDSAGRVERFKQKYGDITRKKKKAAATT